MERGNADAFCAPPLLIAQALTPLAKPTCFFLKAGQVREDRSNGLSSIKLVIGVNITVIVYRTFGT